MIPYGRQDISEQDIQAVVDVLRSNTLTQGPAVTQFERVTADYCGAKYTLATSNATAALHLACLALGLGAGDVLWTASNTFAASSNCALYCGATVDFVDIDARTYNMSVSALEKKLQLAERDGCLPKILIPVHFSGQSCQMRQIKALSDRYGFKIIEDASHAIGGKYCGEPVGNCSYSDISVFSFHPVKIITTGEGGLLLTNDGELSSRLDLLRSHGIERDPSRFVGDDHSPWMLEMQMLGYNYRMTDMQAALGTSQMRRLDEFVASRHALVTRYNAGLAGLPLVLPWQDPDCFSAFHLYMIRLDLTRVGRTRREVFDGLRQAGVYAHVHYNPVHLHPYYRQMGFNPGDFPETEKYHREAITLPMYSSLSTSDQDHVINTVRALVQ
jgi:UDP-4-amino-4,6-dideoxy-N-acetyl-beta-L-altrosamine transaminase